VKPPAEGIERVRQLDPAARNEVGPALNRDLIVLADHLARLARGLTANPHGARHDRRRCPRSRRKKPTFRHERVKPFAHRDRRHTQFRKGS
jgi:hypothetical protein